MTERLNLNENEVKILRYAKDRFVKALNEFGMESINQDRKLSAITRNDLYREKEGGGRIVSVGRSRVWNILHDSLIQEGFMVKLEKFERPKFFHITKKGLDYLTELGDSVETVSENNEADRKSSLAQFYAKKVQVICPVCKKRGMCEVPESTVINNDNTTTVSIPAGMVCEHHFQAFIDKNFAVRGYQKVDVNLSMEITAEPETPKATTPHLEEFKYPPIKPQLDSEPITTIESFNEFIKELYEKQEAGEIKPTNFAKDRPKTLWEIYLDFREFISSENETFIEYIKRDPHRKVLVKA